MLFLAIEAIRKRRKDSQYRLGTAERKARWENSGLGILDYIRSRMEDGDPEFDLDWEIVREMANDRAESRFSIGVFTERLKAEVREISRS